MDRLLPPIATVVSFIDCINRGDLDGLAHLMAAEHRLQVFDEAPLEGKDANVKAWRGYMTSFPSYVIYPKRLSSKGPVVAVLGTTTGSHLRLPDQEEVRLSLIWVSTVKDGKLVSWQLVKDTAEQRAALDLD
jgi:hypothetical protein